MKKSWLLILSLVAILAVGCQPKEAYVPVETPAQTPTEETTPQETSSEAPAGESLEQGESPVPTPIEGETPEATSAQGAQEVSLMPDTAADSDKPVHIVDKTVSIGETREISEEGDGLRVRSYATTASKKLTTVNAGDQVKVLEKIVDGEGVIWIKIEGNALDGKQGYIPIEFIK